MGRVCAAAMRCVLFCAAGLLIASCAGTPPPPPPAPPPKPATFWPTNGWQTSTPEAQGIDSGWLAYAVQMMRYKNLPVHSLLIERHGSVVLDAYFQPFADNQLHDVASVTKSVLSTLVGIAQAKQQVSDLNSPVMPILAQDQSADARKARLSLAHLLSMTSGLDCSAKDGQNFLQQMISTAHWTNFALQREAVAEPGTSFKYCAVNMELVSAVLSRKTGTSAAEFAQRELFAPLGIRYFSWPTDADGISHGYADLKLQPRDMAKLGYLWLHHGIWEDRPLVPSSYLDAALTPHAQVNRGVKYGYGMWLYPNGKVGCPADFEANGNGGQRIAVIPSKDVVVVITGAGLNADDVISLIAPAWRRDLPLQPNAQANARLSAAIARPAAAPEVLMAATTARPALTTPISAPLISPAAPTAVAAQPQSTATASTVSIAPAAAPPGASNVPTAPVIAGTEPAPASSIAASAAPTSAVTVASVAPKEAVAITAAASRASTASATSITPAAPAIASASSEDTSTAPTSNIATASAAPVTPIVVDARPSIPSSSPIATPSTIAPASSAVAPTPPNSNSASSTASPSTATTALPTQAGDAADASRATRS